jgi:hypothetical protein
LDDVEAAFVSCAVVDSASTVDKEVCDNVLEWDLDE